MLISFKNFNLTISKNKYPLSFVWYIFEDWKNDEIKKQFFESIDYFGSEVRAKRIENAPRRLFDIVNKGGKNHTKDGSPGDKLEIIFDPAIPIDAVEEFLRNFIRFHRAEPFHKPQKNLLQFLKEKIF